MPFSTDILDLRAKLHMMVTQKSRPRIRFDTDRANRITSRVGVSYVFCCVFLGACFRDLPTDQLRITTAGIFPELFSDDLFFARSKTMCAVILAVFMVVGFGLRVGGLGTESLGEDELNKLDTVREYRENGLSGKNGEHPFLMKGLQTASIVVSERISSLTGSQIAEEAALRFPIALFGTFTALLLFLLISEIFGRSIGLISAVFWTLEPIAIGFDRIAKEDSLVLFFFLLTMYFWVRGQTRAELGDQNWTWDAWAAAAGFAGLMASKYYPHLLAIVGAYYIVFQYIPATKWRMEPARWLKFFIVMGVAFLILNPTILLPETWREMLKFSSESRIGHDSYEFLGQLYTNKMSAWLNGVPWTFFYVFIAVKSSLPILILCLIGLPLMFLRRMGDGRFLIFFWAFMWFLPFTVLGGKFTRYFTFVEPLILVIAATGFYFAAKWVSERVGGAAGPIVQAVLLIAIVAIQLSNSLSATPHFRLFTNTLGGGASAAGSYFPHDEFYDAATAEIVRLIAATALSKATIACETPGLFEYYAEKAGRRDLKVISLSDKTAVAMLAANDFVVLAEGRRYFSNSAYIAYLTGSGTMTDEIKLNGVTAARIYKLSEPDAEALRDLAVR